MSDTFLSYPQKKYIDHELVNIDDNDELLLVAFGITNPLSISLMQKDWLTSDLPNKALGRDDKSTKKIRPKDFGGCITLIKIDRLTKIPTILAEIDILMPMGLCFCDKTSELLVGSAFGILTVKGGNTIRNLKHNLFSQVHGISKAKKGFIAACTNTDSIVQFEVNSEDEYVSEIWKWLATDNGYDLDTKGKERKIDPSNDYQFVDEGGTRSHSTHLNSATEYSDDSILTTLFHQDELLMIDKKTKNSEAVLSNMTNLHHIKKNPSGGYMFSATRDNKIVFLNDQLEIIKIIKEDFDWVQDCEIVDKNIIISDNNNSRFVLFDSSFNKISEIKWDKGLRKVSNSIRVTGKEAKIIFGVN